MPAKTANSSHRVSKPRQKDVRKRDSGGSDSFIAERLKNNLSHLADSATVGKKTQMYTQIADDLSAIAGRANHPWTWRYIQSVASGTITPGKEFVSAFKVFMEDLSPREKQWFYFLRHRSLATVFDKSVLRSQIIRQMQALGFRSVTFSQYQQAKQRIRRR